MSADDFEQHQPVSQYGAARKAAWLARLQANADMADQRRHAGPRAG